GRPFLRPLSPPAWPGSDARPPCRARRTPTPRPSCAKGRDPLTRAPRGPSWWRRHTRRKSTLAAKQTLLAVGGIARFGVEQPGDATRVPVESRVRERNEWGQLL